MKVICDSRIKGLHRKKHDFLRIDLDLSADGKFRVTIMDFLKKILAEFPETI